MKRVSITNYECSPIEMFNLANFYGLDMFQPCDAITDSNGFVYYCKYYPWYWILYWKFFIFMRRRNQKKNETKLLAGGSK